MKFRHSFLLTLVVAIWGINFVFVKIGLQEIPPILLCCLRFFFTSLPAVLFFKFPKVPFKQLAIYSSSMLVFQFVLMFSAMHLGLSAGLGSLVLQTQVFFSLFFSAYFLNEKIGKWQWLGALVSFAGIGVVGAHLGADATPLSLALAISAAAMWGLGSILVKKMGPTDPTPLLVWGSFLAWPQLLLLSLALEESAPLLWNLHTLSLNTALSVLFIVLFSTLFGFGVWNRMVQIYPVSMVAPFTLLVPVFGILSSILFLNEPLEPWKILAGCLILAGLCIYLLSARLFLKKDLQNL